jgi:AhpD family alkylhydroperoxidase
MMEPRASYQKVAPDVLQGMLALQTVIQKSGLAPGLVDLVNQRVSQINGCAFCLDMHSKDLRARGETEQRIYMLSAWREVPNLYNARERAALAWAEAVTHLTNQEVSDEIYNQAREEFSEKELVVARAVQGFATGLATATLGATILDTDRIRGPVLNRSNLRPRVFHVRFGSLAGMAASNLDVCLIPKSGHWPIARRCLLQATSGGIPYQIRDHQTISRPRR